jgi:hypothetical protein
VLSNKADIALLESAGIERPIKPKKKKPTFRMVAWAIRSTVRMKMGAAQWNENRKIHDRIMAKIEQMKKQAARKSITSGR